jgi:hypothetical protein
MKIQSLFIEHSTKETFVTIRENDEQKCFVDKDFYPFYYETCEPAKAEKYSYYGDPVRKVYINNAWDLRKLSKRGTWEIDVGLEYSNNPLIKGKDFKTAFPDLYIFLKE